MFWLAELGKAGNISQFSRVNNNVDFCNTCISIARQLDWSSREKEVALYDSEHLVYLYGATLLQQCLVSCGRLSASHYFHAGEAPERVCSLQVLMPTTLSGWR